MGTSSKLSLRPKCPFFYGEDVRYTRRMMYSLLTADDQALIREAFTAENGAAHPVFNQTALDGLISDIAADPEYDLLDSLLPLVNMGLLAKMAQLDCAAALMPGTRLLKMDQNAEKSACSYIAVDDKIEYELSEHEMKDWLQVLRRIDGRRSINEILAEL
ncbi:MAG: hypothetical protein GY862_15620, partial [Gammaproteobacteria bacterium]|nr:hypothetical protein [Gammaproteobacteria bacterium]